MFYIFSASHFRKSFDWATDILSGAGWVPHNNIFVQSDERKFPGRSGRGQKTKRDLNRELKEFEEVDNKRSNSGGIGACDDGKDYCEDPRGNEIISFQWKKFFWSFLVWRLVLALTETGILSSTQCQGSNSNEAMYWLLVVWEFFRCLKHNYCGQSMHSVKAWCSNECKPCLAKYLKGFSLIS